MSSNSLQPTRLVPSWSFLWSPMLFFYCCYRKLAWSQSLTTIQIWTSQVVQWLRVHLPMQGTWTRALVWEYPTCHGQLRSCTTASERVCDDCGRPHILEPCAPEREATAASSPSPATREEPQRAAAGDSSCAATKTWHSQKWEISKQITSFKNTLISHFKV